MTMVGEALKDLASKLQDGKIDEAEIEDSLEKVGALGNEPVLWCKGPVGQDTDNSKKRYN